MTSTSERKCCRCLKDDNYKLCAKFHRSHLHVRDRTCEDRDLKVDVVTIARQYGRHNACHCAVSL